jgi:hypothetical protein
VSGGTAVAVERPFRDLRDFDEAGAHFGRLEQDGAAVGTGLRLVERGGAGRST